MVLATWILNETNAWQCKPVYSCQWHHHLTKTAKVFNWKTCFLLRSFKQCLGSPNSTAKVTSAYQLVRTCRIRSYSSIIVWLLASLNLQYLVFRQTLRSLKKVMFGDAVFLVVTALVPKPEASLLQIYEPTSDGIFLSSARLPSWKSITLNDY